MRQPGAKPEIRKKAHAILSELDKSRHATLDQLLDNARNATPEMPQRDKAFLQALLFGVLRSKNRIDWVIRHFSRTPFKKIDPGIKNILRLGVYQILYMDRVPDSAAVNTCVEMAKAVAAPWTVKFVNGVLRNVTRNPNVVPFPELSKDPVLAMSVRKSLPRWLVKRWLTRFGVEDCARLCAAVNIIPPLSLRTNTLQTTRAALVQSLADVAKGLEKTRHSPEGIHIYGLQAGLQTIPAFIEGHFQIQDEAAQLVAHLLAPRPGQRVLDACAGLGGKTGHIAQLMQNTGEIIALDNVGKKLTSLALEMRRLRITNVRSARHDLDSAPTPSRYGTFDRILLDAPCSGLGVVRRNPDTRWNRNEKDLGLYAARQRRYLANLAGLVKPGGLLVYAVCSTEPEENEGVTRHFLEHNPAFVKIKIKSEAHNNLAAVTGSDDCIRTFPHKHNMDGFFATGFKRLK